MSSIRIAIIGGGIAGTSLMYALKKYSHLDVHIFESAAEFKEADMALGVACSTRVALELMGPEAEWFLERAGAVPMKSVRIMFAQGEAARKVADEINEEDQWKHLMGVVHRAAFFQELLSHIPRCRMHASKKLQKIDRSDSITLYFADGTTHECDILVGADGIHSTVRKLVLGESDPAASPQRNGAWLLETHQPFNKARASLGEKLVDMGNICEYGWMGCNAFLTHNILGGGQLVRFAICSFAKEAKPSDRWQRKVGADEIRELFRDFPPRPKYAVNEVRRILVSFRYHG
ncbi:FAD/NAD(P)-binding domain-containing protein [Rostrohypoxylon terebratum]|nr:FAD/NAD(P)-binding domain-containing protein [Rostrohypoxylon terebratum]